MSKPSREEAALLIQQVVSVHTELNEQWEALRKLTGIECGSALGRSIWSMDDKLIRCAEELIWDDANTLAWYIWENECGNKKLRHSVGNTERMKTVKDVESLLDVLGY